MNTAGPILKRDARVLWCGVVAGLFSFVVSRLMFPILPRLICGPAFGLMSLVFFLLYGRRGAFGRGFSSGWFLALGWTAVALVMVLLRPHGCRIGVAVLGYPVHLSEPIVIVLLFIFGLAAYRPWRSEGQSRSRFKLCIGGGLGLLALVAGGQWALAFRGTGPF